MHNSLHKYILRLCLIGFLATFFNSCIIVIHEKKEVNEYEPEITLSPKPILKMSDLIIRSEKGDMIAFLPDQWFLIDVESKISSDVIATAINPDYTLSIVFSHLRNNELIEETVSKEGLYGLARLSLERRENKTMNMVKQIGRYQTINMGNQEFVKYEYSSTGGAMVAKSAVFISSTGEYYEFSLVPLNIKNNLQPTSKELDEIFQSILASIKY